MWVIWTTFSRLLRLVASFHVENRYDRQWTLATIGKLAHRTHCTLDYRSHRFEKLVMNVWVAFFSFLLVVLSKKTTRAPDANPFEVCEPFLTPLRFRKSGP